MPQADDDTRALMKKWFGDEVDTEGPLNFLLSHGWTDYKGLLVPPVESHTPSIPELHCAWFLCDEWDFAYNGRFGVLAKDNL